MKGFFKSLAAPNILAIIFVGLIYWMWWIPGVRVSNDLSVVSTPSLTAQFDLPRLWHSRGAEGMGEMGTFILWSWPYNFLSGFLALIGLNFSLQLRLFFIIPTLILGSIGIKKVFTKYNLSKSSIFISTVFYLTTTYLLLLIDGGQLSIALIYALFPLVYIWTTDAIKEDIRKKLSALLLLALITTLDVRFLFVTAIILFIRFVFDLVYEEKKKKVYILRSYLYYIGVIGVGWVLLNLFWIIPILKYPIPPTIFTSLTQNIGIQPTTWKHAFLLFQPHWYKNVFGVVQPVNYYFILIPLLAFLTPVISFFRKNRDNYHEILFWTFIALIGVFLTKGANPPFGSVYNFLFNKIPGFSLFRDTSKFFFLIALSYSVLIGFSVDYISTFLSKLKTKSRFLKSYILNSKLLIIFLISYFLFLTAPVYLGKMTGMFSFPIYKKESLAVSDKFEKDGGFSRIFYIPSLTPLGYSSPLHPSVEALRLLSKRPFAIGTVGKYEQFNYLREAPFMGEIFAISSIKYLYYPYPDEKRETLKQDNIDYYYVFLDQLSNLPWIEKRVSKPPIAVLQTKKTKEHIFLAGNSFFVVGSDRIYWDLMNINEFDLSNNALVFIEENPELITNIDNSSKIIVYDKNETDLLMSYIDKQNLYFPSFKLSRDPTETQKWWKRQTSDLVWWKDFLQTKYGIDNLDFDLQGGWAIAEGGQELTINEIQGIKNKMLYARAMKSSKGGRIEFWQGERKIGDINTLVEQPEKVEIKLTGYKDVPDKISAYGKADFNWYKVGFIPESGQPITIKTFGGINVINVMALITETEVTEIKKIISNLSDAGRILYWGNLSDSEKQKLFNNTSGNELLYKKINSTKYEVDITSLTRPSYLIFSDIYNELWELNGEDSKPIYSLVNGFYIEKPGKYTIYFTPQKYIYLGLIISLISFSAVTGILVYIKIKSKKKP